ncbi:TPA: hypothetical protein ACH3X1_002256 [Trebouxia sp. C0004]
MLPCCLPVCHTNIEIEDLTAGKEHTDTLLTKMVNEIRERHSTLQCNKRAVIVVLSSSTHCSPRLFCLQNPLLLSYCVTVCVLLALHDCQHLHLYIPHAIE